MAYYNALVNAAVEVVRVHPAFIDLCGVVSSAKNADGRRVKITLHGLRPSDAAVANLAHKLTFTGAPLREIKVVSIAPTPKTPRHLALYMYFVGV